MTGRVGSVPEISVFPTEISVSGLEILPYEHFIPVTGMNVGMNSGGPAMASSCIACSIFHIISIPFKTAVIQRQELPMLRQARKLNFCVWPCFVSRILRQNSFTGSLTFSHLGNGAEICHMNPTRNSSR